MPAKFPLRGALVAAVLLGGCGGRREDLPNLVLISIDTLRADHLGCYGYARDTSPNLDRMARQGILFEHAYAPAPWTLPSHASLFTGLYPAEHGIVTLRDAIDERHVLLPEALAEQGYRSAAVVSAVPFLRRAYGFAQGWIDYDDESAYGDKLRQAEDVQRAAVVQLDRLGAGPFFLFVHHFDVHATYSPPPPYRTMFGGRRNRSVPKEEKPDPVEGQMALYDGEIRWVDHWIGELVAELERRQLLERTVVAVVSDHGEEFGEHGAWQHGESLFNGALRVPWIVRLPGALHAGRRIASPVSLVDVPATLLALAGGATSGWRAGRNLAPALTGAAASFDDAALFAGRRFDDDRGQRAIIAGGYKAIFWTDAQRLPRLPAVGLYRLADDPDETTDLAASDAGRIAALYERLRAATLEQLRRRQRLPPGRRDAPTGEEEKKLRAFGYI